MLVCIYLIILYFILLYAVKLIVKTHDSGLQGLEEVQPLSELLTRA